MKITTYLYLFTLIFMFSCDTEDVDGLLAQTQATENNTPNEENNEPEILSSSPCNFDLNEAMTNNTTVTIDCILDLNKQTVTIPANVTLEYNGGQIINGALSFDTETTIDSRLLNNTLTIEGTPSLKGNTFEFTANRWGVVEGITTSENALNNNKILENLMFVAKQYGATTFKMNKIDAYFEVSKVTSTTSDQNFYPSIEAINIPSDFNLIMTDNTHLRVFPNNNERYSLLAVRDSDNITITGGNLYGDRDQHDYSGGGTHEWGTVLNLHSAVNVTVTGVNASFGTGDGLGIHSLGFSFSDDYKPSNNIVIKKCTFEANRRNNLAITDGFNILVEENTFLNAGIDTPYSKGTLPKFGIDIEAHRERDQETDEIILYEKAEQIIIRKNTERGSVEGGFIVYIANDVILEENTVESGLAWSFTTNTKIRNNIVKANPNRSVNVGITGGRSDNIRTTFGNEISGNEIEGFPSGIIVFSKGNKIYNNTIKETETGIFLKNLKETEIYNNTITSSLQGSIGIFAHLSTLEDVAIFDDIIDTQFNSYTFTQVNTTSEASSFSFSVQGINYTSSQSFNIQ